MRSSLKRRRVLPVWFSPHNWRSPLAALVLCLVLGPVPATAQGPSRPTGNAFASVQDAVELSRTLPPAQFRAMIADLRKEAATARPDAGVLFLIAELYRQLGDYRAEEYYRRATRAAPEEPAYELFFAEYLRNFRGALRPLFPEAEAHYYAALRKYHARKDKQTEPTPQAEREYLAAVGERIERGLINLYQEDGFPVEFRTRRGVDIPVISIASINRFSHSTADLDEIHDARDFTAEAALAGTRLSRSLTEQELRGVLRSKDAFETLLRFRLRYGELPAVDVFASDRHINNAQITRFDQPGRFNDVELSQYGVSFEKPLGLAPHLDANLRGTYRRLNRTGVVEFLPETQEDIDQYESRLTLSRFVGPDKANLALVYAFQDIAPQINNPAVRKREIAGATLDYQILRPIPFLRPAYSQRFTTRGLHLFGGAVRDRERFGPALVSRDDYFVGTRFNGVGPFDITLQPALIRYSVRGGITPAQRRLQEIAQQRTDLTVVYRLLDEERQPAFPKRRILGLYPAFVHVVLPVRHDSALEGLDRFENFRIGVGVDVKLFSRGEVGSLLKPEGRPRYRGSTYLLSTRYEYQRFYELDRGRNLFSVMLSMGF